MSIIYHPSHFISAAIVERIRNAAAEAERSGSLRMDQLEMIYEQHWFNLFVPRSRGGLELSLPEALQIEEALAWTDGSMGWTVTLCSGANWFIGFLQPEPAAEIFNDPRVCLAGSGRASGVARVIGTAYEISGCWAYATGAPHATAFTANCRIEKDGVALQNEDGSPMVRAFLFLKDEVIVHEDWGGMGLIATASYSFEVKRKRIPENRCFRIDADHTVLTQRIYQYPFLQLAEATLAVNSAGMALHFIDLCDTLFAERAKYSDFKGMATALDRLEMAKAVLQELRRSFYTTLVSSWEECMEHKPPTNSLLKEVSETSRRLAAEARRQVDELYPWCGMQSANRKTEINRVWRDLHTASQHSLLTLQA